MNEQPQTRVSASDALLIGAMGVAFVTVLIWTLYQWGL